MARNVQSLSKFMAVKIIRKPFLKLFLHCSSENFPFFYDIINSQELFNSYWSLVSTAFLIAMLAEFRRRAALDRRAHTTSHTFTCREAVLRSRRRNQR